MNKNIESTATMTDDALPSYQTDAPPSYQTDAPPVYSPIPYQALDNPVFYHINRPVSDYEIYSADEALAFYIEIHTWNISKPDLRIYRGNKESGQKVAECRYGENASPSQCDSGWLRQRNPSHHLGGKMTVAWWTRSTRDSPRAVQYRFAALVEQPEMIEQEPIVKTPRTFVWVKSSNLVLLEEETRTVAALVHESTSDPSKCGTLEIIVSYGNDFNLIVLSTFVALFDKQRRHAKRTSGDHPGEESLRGKIGGIMGALKRGRCLD